MLRTENDKYDSGIRCFCASMRIDFARGWFPQNSGGMMPDGRTRCFENHSHETVEVLIGVEGHLYAQVDGRDYTVGPGDCLIVNPFRNHTGYAHESDVRTVYRVILFEPKFFMPSVPSLLAERLRDVLSGKRGFTEYLPSARESAARLRALSEQLFDCYAQRNTPAGECGVIAGCYQLLGLFLEDPMNGEPIGGVTGSRNAEFVERVQDWVAKNYTQPVSTADICRDLSYNMAHFCHLFKNNFGVSFSSFLCEYRVSRAIKLYLGSGRTVSEIASAVGFADSCYFSRVFKRYTGSTPSRYFHAK